MSEITLKIDGIEIKAAKGDTVLDAARRAGIRIPTLCAHPALEPLGSCRLCIVNIEGMRGNPTSCTTPATNGMVVHTRTEEIVELRREIIKLLLSNHTSPCLVCNDRTLCEKYRPRPLKAGKTTRCTFCANRDNCELRQLVAEYEINDFDLPIIYKNIPLERRDPFMDRDYNLCVLCGRCERICKKIHGKGTLSFINRGEDARIGTAFGLDHTEADCKFCGACIDICPTGVLADRFAKWHGAPDRFAETSCVLCPLGCRVRLSLKEGKVLGGGMTDLSRAGRICALGRFGLAQLLSNPRRLTAHRVRIADGLIKTDYEDAVSEAASRLLPFKGDSFALLTHPQASREEIYILDKFTRQVMKSKNIIITDAATASNYAIPAEVKALYMTGDLVDTADQARLATLDALVIADLFPSAAQEAAHVVIAAAALAETDGTFVTASDEIRPLTKAAVPAAGLNPDWRIICDIAKNMGASDFDFESTEQIKEEMTATGFLVAPGKAPVPSPLDNVRALPQRYRGHLISDIVIALRDIGGHAKPAASPEPAPASDNRPFRIIEKIEVVPNTHITTIHAPAIAEKCLPGQFVIAMVSEKSERIPYTICDFDREKGSITLVTLELGRSSRELALLGTGDCLAHVAGPLGEPVEVKNYGTVVCAGGCYGVGAIFPIARAMKEAGNRVICIEEASSHYLLHWQDKLSAVCDEFLIVTKDGSVGMKGGIQDVIAMLVKRGEKIDQSYIIGCTFMMMLVSRVAKELAVPVQTAMNPIMLDGTGMCGACRVNLDGEMKFACVDGPFFDGLKIDWEELIKRNSAYGMQEVESLPQSGVRVLTLAQACRCENK